MIKVWVLVIFLILLSASLRAQEVISDNPYLVYIRPGSVLVRVSDKKEFLTEKGIYTKVQEKHVTKKDVFNVYNSKNELIYTTAAENILEIAEDIRIYPKVDAEIIYPPRTTFRAANKTFDFDTQFNLHLDSLDAEAFASYYLPDSSDVSSTRFEFRTMYQSNLPVDFGVSLSYQHASWFAEDQKITNQILGIGPVIEYDFYRYEWLSAKAVLSAEFTPIYETKSPSSIESYSALIYDLGLEINFTTKLGIISLGTHYRQHELNLSSSTRMNASGFEQEEISYNSMGVMLGYKIDWQL